MLFTLPPAAGWLIYKPPLVEVLVMLNERQLLCSVDGNRMVSDSYLY